MRGGEREEGGANQGEIGGVEADGLTGGRKSRGGGKFPRALPPLPQDLLAAARLKAQVAAQLQKSGFRHHVLAFLVALDGLGDGCRRFQQYVAGHGAALAPVDLGCTRGSAETGGTRPPAPHA